MLNLVGSRVNRIRVVSIIGEGGMGCVYEGYDETLRRRVALKAIHADGPADPESRARLIREARALARIDHPNLCHVYDVVEHEGADYLALEFIEGRTLQQAVLAGLTFQEKVRIGAAIADVLAAAHRLGILHRDLKPENVMLTRDGVVKVLDFGLARFLDSAPERQTIRDARQWELAASNAAYSAPRPLPDARTMAGIVVGTPLYMSPEQARGGRLTTASDMYSFGLLLQYIFDGRDAYPEDADAVTVMHMAAAGKSAALLTRDADVRALITGLKSLAPADRPTAIMAARRLYAIGRRPVRRARIAAAAALVLLAAGGATKYAVDLKRERSIALAARAEADKRRAAADELIGFMIGDLEPKLGSVGKLDILDAVAEKSLHYFASLPPESISPTDLRRNADALMDLGSLRISQGRSDQAAVAFQRAIELAQRTMALRPDDADAVYTLGRAHSWLGIMHYQKGETEAGIAQMEKYAAAAERLARMAPDRSAFQRERSIANVNLGSFAETLNDLDRAIRHYEVALTVTRERARRAPGDTDVLSDLQAPLNKIAWAEFKIGRFDDARRHYEEERRILQSLLKRDPQNEFWRQRLAINHDYLGTVRMTMGDIDGALQEFASDIALQERAVARDPDNVVWRRNLAAAYRQQGDTLRGRDPVRAMESYSDAAETIAPLLAKQTGEMAPALEQGMIEIGMARALLRQQKLGRARTHAERAVAVLGPLKGGADKQRRHGFALVTLGEIDAAAGRAEQARASWLEAERVLPPRTPAMRDPRMLDTWARVLLLLDRDAEAQPLLATLDAMGYRSSDLDTLRKS